MPDVSVLEVLLSGRHIGTLTMVQGLRTLFTFTDDYIADQNRPTLSLSFKDQFGGLITGLPETQVAVPPFFSNLLPEGPLRDYLAKRAGVNAKREFFLLWVLGRDLPGAVTVRPAEGEALPPALEEALAEEGDARRLKFSLAGVQLKFSALKNAGKGGGLTIPTEGIGGHWIVKLPSMQYPGMPENEFSFMTIAAKMGMNIPDVQLNSLDDIAGLPEGIGRLEGSALAVRRFDRSADGPVHMEDFAQVFGVFPDEKYETRTYRSIAKVINIEVGVDGLQEFVRRLVLSTIIGNADMHLKNWSLLYPDGRTPVLSPAYDMLSTIPYIKDDTAALRYAKTKKMTEFSWDELRRLAAKAQLPEKPVFDAAEDAIERFRAVWSEERKNLPLAEDVVAAVEAHAARVPIFNEKRD